MAFNPDDFQFEKILPPEERKPIVEWDALHRLMVVRVKQDGEWTYLATKLDPQVNTNLHNNLPNEWSNENDRIVSFSIFEDGEHIFEKEKLKFDFATKQSKWVRYEKNDLTEGQVRELFNIIKAALAVQQLDSDINKSKAIINVATRQEYLSKTDEEKKATLQTLLRSSDWTQLPDATESFPSEIEMWSAYRTYLRDNIKTPEDFDDMLDYLIWDEEYNWPIDPFAYHELDPDHETPYLSVPEHFKFSAYEAGSYTTEKLVGNVKQSALLAKKRQEEGGLPLTKQIWDKIQQYNLNDGLTGAVIENLNITGG
jgi:hypothetical protein